MVSCRTIRQTDLLEISLDEVNAIASEDVDFQSLFLLYQNKVFHDNNLYPMDFISEVKKPLKKMLTGDQIQLERRKLELTNVFKTVVMRRVTEIRLTR